MVELFTESALLFVGVVFAFALVIGSFLNVVIHRLPIMMERDWRTQCEELCKTTHGSRNCRKAASTSSCRAHAAHPAAT